MLRKQILVCVWAFVCITEGNAKPALKIEHAKQISKLQNTPTSFVLVVKAMLYDKTLF